MSTVTDPIADLLARVRNGAQAQKPELFVPYSRIKAEIARILKEEGYITDYELDRTAAHPRIKITNKLVNRASAITGLKRVSRPGLRRYVGADEIPRVLSAKVENSHVSLARAAVTQSVKALPGLSRALLNSMVRGVSEGFTKDLEIEGVGFKAAVQGQKLNLSLGFSHRILFSIPKDIKITVTENTKLTITGIDKKLVGQVAADIRRYYPPEPYKGKGVRYA